MAKENFSTKEALNDLMGNSVKTKEPSLDLRLKQKDEYKNFTIRLSVRDRAILENHFKSKGIITLAIGLRSIIADYMKNNNLS
jgi:hypothetical protein